MLSPIYTGKSAPHLVQQQEVWTVFDVSIKPQALNVLSCSLGWGCVCNGEFCLNCEVEDLSRVRQSLCERQISKQCKRAL